MVPGTYIHQTLKSIELYSNDTFRQFYVLKCVSIYEVMHINEEAVIFCTHVGGRDDDKKQQVG